MHNKKGRSNGRPFPFFQKLAENIGEPYTKEALLLKRNWMLYKM